MGNDLEVRIQVCVGDLVGADRDWVVESSELHSGEVEDVAREKDGDQDGPGWLVDPAVVEPKWELVAHERESQSAQNEVTEVGLGVRRL